MQKIKDITIKNVVSIQKQEELDLVTSLGLTAQVEIIKLEMQGYRIVRRADLKRLLKTDEDLTAYRIDKFTGRIPFGVVCKLQELKENRLFDRLYVIAPSIASNSDPLFIGEKFLPLLSKHWDSDLDFWSRPRDVGSIIVLISQWG